jgi:inner membrane protein
MYSSDNSVPSAFEQLKNSQFVRILIVLFLILILQIPTLMLQNQVSQRQSLRQEAITDITSKWGKQQTVIGPRLVVPYIKRIQTADDKVKSEVKRGVFLPDDLKITSKMDSETRYRGIFEVPVYRANVTLQGKYNRPDFSNWGVKPEDILWDQAELSVQIADARAIKNQAFLQWNQAKAPFLPGQGKFGASNGPGIYAGLRNQMDGKEFNFTIGLNLNGSEQINFAPFGKVTQVKMSSNWTNPSFQGAYVPDERTPSAKGFEATWDIPSLGRNYPQQWNSENPIDLNVIQQSTFGVDLLSPVDNYRMSERSIKYNFLFLILTFATFWLFEVTVRLRVHPLQYLLVGVAMSMFYLLQLALSEHLGFHWAYLISSVAVVTLIASYSIAVLRANKRGGIIGLMQVALYGYLYVVLANQDYSLLMGSIGLFIFLAIVMYFTRRIDWFDPRGRDSDRISASS